MLKAVSVLAVRLLLAVGLAVLAATGAAQDANLRSQVQALSAQHGFNLFGASKIDQLPSVVDPDGSLDEQLRTMLADHNFIIIRGGDGAIRSVRVSGRKGPPPDLSRKVAVNTVRRGSNHYLEAVVTGLQGAPVPVSLMIDTGASTVVLPTSLMETLGFGAGDVREVTMQTANGEADGWLGVLGSVEIGGAYERDVTVAFIDAEKLGHKMLLGMSFLSRYVITIDDKTNRLSMEKRDE